MAGAYKLGTTVSYEFHAARGIFIQLVNSLFHVFLTLRRSIDRPNLVNSNKTKYGETALGALRDRSFGQTNGDPLGAAVYKEVFSVRSCAGVVEILHALLVLPPPPPLRLPRTCFTKPIAKETALTEIVFRPSSLSLLLGLVS